MRRPCLGPAPGTRCPFGATTSRTRCPSCAGQWQARRQANYGRAHQQIRAGLALTLPAPCGGGCGRTLQPDDDWVAAHAEDGDPTSRRFVSCRSCNERSKGQEYGRISTA